MKLFNTMRRFTPLTLLCIALVFAVGAAPQGRGQKVGQQLPNPPGVPQGPVGVVIPKVHVGGGVHQACVQSCNNFHKNESSICKGRTGRDRASCQQSINRRHRLCIQSCPK